MSTEHEALIQEIRRLMDANASGTVDLSPRTIANLAYQTIATGSENILVRYGCVELLTQLSRRELARRFAIDESADPDEPAQADMFQGHLQTRYPISPDAGSERVYRLLQALSDADLAWNVQRLLKLSSAAQRHAQALEVYRLSRDVDQSSGPRWRARRLATLEAAR